MSIKLSCYSQQQLKKKKYKPIVTSFLTEDGPAIGTIWWDSFGDRIHPVTISEIKMVKRKIRVVFTDRSSVSFESFMRGVEIGMWVLIGVTPETISYVEI